MVDNIQIPGMSLSRKDVQITIYERFRKMSENDAIDKAKALTDKQLQDIAYAFSEEFFSVRDGLFAEILNDAVTFVENEEQMAKEMLKDGMEMLNRG